MEANGLPDLRAQYSEGCAALRHYSLCVSNVRVVTIAQGLVLLAGTAAFVQKDIFPLAIVVSLFGIFFSIALWSLQRSYWMCFDAILAAVLKLESFSAAATGYKGPWSSYEESSKAAFGQVWWRILVKHGPYWLFVLAFCAVLIRSLLGLSLSECVVCTAVRSWFCHLFGCRG